MMTRHSLILTTHHEHAATCVHSVDSINSVHLRSCFCDFPGEIRMCVCVSVKDCVLVYELLVSMPPSVSVFS